jgi:hypothetical integral membrane protein (TIGR02206 family)
MGWPPTFEPFGTAHLSALAAIVLAAAVVPLLAARLFDARGRAIGGMVLAAGLLLHEIVKVPIRVHGYGEPLTESLPLHLCGLAALMTAWVLWRRSYRVHEIAYFWGIGGSLPALLTPDLPYDFPHPWYFIFFVGHGLIVVGVVYATVVHRLRPTFRSVGKTFVASVALVAVMIPVNGMLGANYLYLRAKPEGATLVDYMGPWPWYVAVMVVAGLVVTLACYAPLALSRPRPRVSHERP